MFGLEWCFFEAVGKSVQAKWHYQPGVGSYRKINSYQYVGVGKGEFVKDESLFGSSEWLPVGPGSGSYVRIQTFQHVGTGQGDYDKEEITSFAEWRLRPCCIWLCLLLLVLLLSLLAMIYWPSKMSAKWESDLQRAVGLGPRSDEFYNCDVDFANWKAAWSDSKKDWCCQNAQRGCNGGYDCNAGFTSWKATWSSNKKQWCCSHRGRGCDSSAELYDCDADYQDWGRKWTKGQKLWCCTVYDRGCPESQFQGRYDCKSQTDLTTWTLQKQTWCCTNSGIGCNLAKHGPKVECTGHPDSWSSTQKTYCCEHEKKGCASTPPAPTAPAPTGCAAQCQIQNQMHSCKARINFAARTTFAHETNACGKAHQKVLSECDSCSGCSLGQVMCQALPVTKPFDCHAALQNWVAAWSSNKKAWCCKHEMKGCGDSFCDNTEELHRWTRAKKAFCCRTKGNGCTGSQPPSLPAGPGYKWRHAKVQGVYTWVRQHDAMKSHPLPHEIQSTTASFDCSDGYADFVHGWSTSKKHWCCEHKGLACTGPNHPAVPLKLQHQWQKKEINGVWTWTQVRSHVTKTYDCTHGLLEAPLDKLAYCCEHFGKACN